MSAKFYNIMEAKNQEAQAVTVARFCDDVYCCQYQLEVMAKKNDDKFKTWKTTHEYIRFLMDNKPHRIKTLIGEQGYTPAQVDVIWDIAHRDNEVCFLLMVATFTEWSKS